MNTLALTTPGLLFPAISLLMLAYTNRFLGLAGVARELIAKQRNISPIPNIDNFMETSLLAELDRAGFIDQLYR